MAPSEPPSLQLATTDSITYSIAPSGPYLAGRPSSITATLTGGTWASGIADWNQVSTTVATLSITFANVTCIVVAPVAPGVAQAVCAGGAVVAPTVTTAEEPAGVHYAVIPSDLGDGTSVLQARVTATIIGGFAWTDPLPGGWEPTSNPSVIVFEVTLAAASCRPVTPEQPDVEQAVCRNGAVGAPTLTLPTTTDITYEANTAPPYRAGQTVVVTATLAASGVEWPPSMPSGWRPAS